MSDNPTPTTPPAVNGTTEPHPPALPDGQTARDEQKVTGFSRVPAAAWAFVLMLTVTAAFGGYVLGNRHGVNTTLEAAGLADALNSAQAGSSGSAGSSGGDSRNDADSGKKPSPTTTAAAGTTSIDELLASGKLTPGTMTDVPVARADGSYNALIFGPGGPLNTREDILNVHRRDPADPFAVGAVDAPVVISEFSDLECPFCARFRNQTEPVIMEKFVNKGLVRLEFNDMPINGPNAVAAAKAGRAAAAQGKFFQFQEILFSQEKSKTGHPNNTIDDFVRYAAEAGVEDLDAFRADATGEKYSDVVGEARAYGSSIGITGTPGFIVGETFISGAQPTETFVELITDELNKVARGDVVPTTPKDAGNK